MRLARLYQCGIAWLLLAAVGCGGGGGGSTPAPAVAPAITTQPTSQAVNLGQMATLSVSASGTAPFAYQWKKDGIALTGATSNVWSIVNTQPADAGSYLVQVSNSVGASTSNPAVITVNSPPAISTQPAGQVLTQGKSLSLSVAVTGTAPFTYQWKKDGLALSGATSTKLDLVNVQAGDAGSYTVAVSNMVGTINSLAASLVVVAPPSITGFSVAKSPLTAGSSTTLSAIYSDGTGTVDHSIGSVSSGVAKGTGVLTTSTAYTLTVTNAAGDAVTRTATVDVVVAPTIASLTTLKPTLTAGTGTTLSFTFASGTGNIDQGVGTVTSGGAIAISPLVATTYTLTVINAAGDAVTRQVTVTVVPAPTITGFAASKTILSLGSGTILSFTFTGGTGNIDAEIGAATSGGTANVSPAVTTIYTLTVTNAAEDTVSSQVTVSVVPLPHITSFSANPSTVLQGTSSTLVAAFESGSGTVDQNLGSILSGGARASTGPLAANTTYTLTVTNLAGDSATASAAVTVLLPTTALFDPGASVVPLPNILVTAAAMDPLTGAYTSHTTGAVVPGARPVNTSMTPAEALAYVNKYEMGSTHAVSGLNAPIYIQFSAPVDATTVTAANIKVFQFSTDAAGTENTPLGFSDISGMFRFVYIAGSQDLLLFPNFPLFPGTKYLYVVTNRVKDISGFAISSSPIFEFLKSTTPLTGSFAALEPIRANVISGGQILLSGYAKVMDDLISSSASTTVTSRADLALLGRFITTGAGTISTNTKYPSDTGASYIPTESALRSFAAGATLGGLTGKSWTNTITVTNRFDRGGVNPSPDAYYTAVLGTSTTAPATVGIVVLGTIDGSNLSIDPVVANANAATIDLSAVTGAYNPAAGIIQAFRPDGLHLTGFYNTTRAVPFVYIAPTGVAPAGGYPLVFFQHDLTLQKENIILLAQSVMAANQAIIAIDLPLHGALQMAGHTTGSTWGQDFLATGAPLSARSNFQQGAFNLHRLELTVRAGGFAGLGAAAPSVTNLKFFGLGIGSMVGANFLAGNTTLSTTGTPYTQTTLNADMRGYLAVPGGRTAYLFQNSPAVGPSLDAALAAMGLTKGSPGYHQYFLFTQTIVDPCDPASLTTPLAAGLPSRLSNRIAIQESTSSIFSTTPGMDGYPAPTNGDMIITNPYTRYLGNALGGRAILGSTAAAAVAPGFAQLAYTAGGGTLPHAAGVVSPFLFTLSGTSPVPKVANAAVVPSDTTPTEGYFQFDQTGIGHISIIDSANATNLGLIQRQVRYFLGLSGNSILVDPTQSTSVP